MAAVRLLDGEPELGPWRVVELAHLVALLTTATQDVSRRPAVVAVDGRSSSGKTSLTRRLTAQISGAAIVHTDDVAWFESAFDWAGLVTEGVLEPVRRGDGTLLAWTQVRSVQRTTPRGWPRNTRS